MEQSGVHEQVAAYALDALDDREREAFEQHLSECTVCKEELDSLRSAAAALAYTGDAPPPSPELRARLLQRVRRESRTAPVVSLHRRVALPAVAALAAAAAAATIALGFWISSLQSSLDHERAARSAQDQALGVLAAPGTSRFELTGASGSLLVAPGGDAALVVSGLPRAPSGKTYEAWVIQRGEPKPAGTFAAGGTRAIVWITRKVPSGARVAVTVEPEGGSARPTSQPLFGAQVS